MIQVKIYTLALKSFTTKIIIMKKNYLGVLFFSLFTIGATAQNGEVSGLRNGLKINKPFSHNVIPRAAADTIFFEDFSGGLGGWTVNDVDGDDDTWTILATDGDSSAYSFSWWQAALTPDNYLISPAINLAGLAGNTLTLEYDVWTYWTADEPDYNAEHYAVYVTISNDPATIANATPVYETTVTATELERITLDISNLAGSTVYVTFRHFEVTDMFYMGVDNILVASAQDASVSFKRKIMETTVFPNPSNGTINVKTASVNSTVEVYNTLGAIVAKIGANGNNIVKVDLTSQPKGVYFVKVTENGSTSVSKVSIH
jgi:hypothetical protein